MANMTRPRLIFAALRDRAHNQPAPAMSRLGHVETEILAAIKTTIHAQLERLAKRVEPWRAQLAADGKEVVTLRDAFAAKVAEAGGRTSPLLMLPTWCHWGLLCGITLGEMAFNAQAFGLLGDAQWVTWLTAMAIGVALPCFAALLGVQLRSGTWNPARIAAWSGISIVVILGGVVINMVRSRFLEAVQVGDSLTSYSEGLNLAYFFMNLFIFVAATVVSYAGTDPVPGFVRARRRLIFVERRIIALRARITREQNLARTEAARLAEAGMNLMLLYRGTNRRKRAAVPGYFDVLDHNDYGPSFMTELEAATTKANAASPAVAFAESPSQ